MEDPGTGTSGTAVRRRSVIARARVTRHSAAVGLAVVGLLVVAGERSLAWQGQRQHLADERAAAAAAKAEVDGLVGISSATSEEDMATLIDGATAGFRTELEAQADRLRGDLRQSKVATQGEVVSTGVVALDEHRATVVVAATGTVSNGRTKQGGTTRNYRLRVDLQKHGERWLVSRLEFVS